MDMEEEKILTPIYDTVLTILEDYTDQLASGGPDAVCETLNSLQGALAEVQYCMARKYQTGLRQIMLTKENK